MDFEYKMVIITRNDLPLSIGKQCVQIAHAAVSCALSTKKNKPKWFIKWEKEGAKKVVVKVDSINDFRPLEKKAIELGIITKLISDAGFTEIPSGTITVLGIGPAPNNIIDQITGELPLL